MKCGALGDMVQLTVLIGQLHARFGLPVDLISSGAWTRPLLEGQPGVGEIHVFRSRRTPFWLSADQQRIARRLRARRSGPVWCCDGELSRRFLQHTGIPVEHICDAAAFPIRPGERMVERWIRFGCATPPAFRCRIEDGKPLVRAASRMVVGPEQRAECDVWLERRGLAGRPIVAVQAGNKRTMRPGPRRRRSNTKYWPEERWGAVLRAIRSHRPACAIVLLGVRRECALNDDIIREANIGDVHNAAGDLPLPRLSALLKRSQSMISVDSGPGHAAAAVGCPVVVLFSTSDPLVNQPTGPGAPVITLTGEVNGRTSILGISVCDVVEAWLSLSREPAARSAGCVDSSFAPSFA
ncbi:MAG: hypothetical protein L0271_26130, partial [Gemmatimonadetes bacterium]|nr:hypothetical protein [Gemmatimonadota bacterium]